MTDFVMLWFWVFEYQSECISGLDPVSGVHPSQMHQIITQTTQEQKVMTGTSNFYR